MTFDDFVYVIHPAIAVMFVFPIIGMVSQLALRVRQRRLGDKTDKKKIAASVGSEHLRLGKWLAASVIGIALLGMVQPIFFKGIIGENLFANDPFKATFLVLMYVATVASLVLLYRGRQPLWRGVFATLTSAGLIILGSSEFVFRRGYEWYVSHYYYGIGAALLMVISLAAIENIYQDRSLGWRRAHAALNAIAVFFFIGQGLTGARDLYEIALFKSPPGFFLGGGLF